MNNYRIQMRVRTPIHLFREFGCRNFRFIPLDPSLRGGFLVQRDLEASDFRAAFAEFQASLMPVLDAASVVTQCAVYNVTQGSFLIYRMNDNPEKLAFFYFSEETETVGMVLDEDEFADVERVLELMDSSERYQRGIGYLRHANLSSSPLYLLSMLIIAAEAFAGEMTVQRPCSKCGHVHEYSASDREVLKSILGDDLYQEIYTRDRLRHKLLHGATIDEGRAAGAALRAYERILLSYLQQKCSLKSVAKILGAPRNVNYSFEFARTFVQIDGDVDLLALEKAMREKRLLSKTDPKEY